MTQFYVTLPFTAFSNKKFVCIYITHCDISYNVMMFFYNLYQISKRVTFY